MSDNDDDDYDVDARLAADLGLWQRGDDEDPSVPIWHFAGTYTASINHANNIAPADSSPPLHRWSPIGPRNVGGRMRAIIQDTADARTFYAGSAFGGVWKTENDGDTWRPVDVSFAPGTNPATHGEAAYPVGAMALCRNKPEHIYVGTGEPRYFYFAGTGAYHSTDRGATWSRVTGPASWDTVERFERIVVDPWDEMRAWFATPQGLFRRKADGSILRDDITGVANAPQLMPQDVTDIAIDFAGDPRAAARPAGSYRVIVGIRPRRRNYAIGPNFGTIDAGGIFFADYDPVAETYGAWTEATGNPAGTFSWPEIPTNAALPWAAAANKGTIDRKLKSNQRIKIAICESDPSRVYAVAGLDDSSASVVFRSSDNGQTFSTSALRPNDDGRQAAYDLFITVHPDDPDIVMTGSVEVWRTTDGGDSWDQKLFREKFRQGDRAHHADQHALIFDVRDPRRVWLCNDHGISHSADLGDTWRTRSFGIQATQLYDLTTHPTYPWIKAAGFQDNGNWISYGSSTWHFCGIADGGAVAFQPRATDVMLTSNQTRFKHNRVELVRSPTLLPGTLGNTRYGSRLPDVPTTVAAGVTQYPALTFRGSTSTQPPGALPAVRWNPIAAGKQNIFGYKLAGNPVSTDQFIIGGMEGAYFSNGGTINGVPSTLSFQQVQNAAGNNPFTLSGEFIASICFAPTFPAVAPAPQSDQNWWVGSSRTKVFLTKDGGANWIDATAPIRAAAGATTPLNNSEHISGIAVHPRNPAIVAIALGRSTDNVLISNNATDDDGAGNSTASWFAISHEPGTPAAQRLPAGPVTEIVFDGDRSLNTGPKDDQTLFVTTMAGVFVTRNAKPDGTGNVEWATFNAGLPLVLLRDLEYAESQNADGSIRRRFLRAGTFGRGAYECDLGGAPIARLMIRSTAIEDGHDYIPAQTVTYDPRLNEPGIAVKPLAYNRAIDIRIDAPPYQFFDDQMDSVEFDEDLRSDTLLLGETNFIYVQVHTRGHAVLSDVDVHLFYAKAPGGIAPDLNPQFWTTYPGEPAAISPWSKAGTARLSELHSGQPRVFRIEWAPPTDLGADVALLAIAEHPNDSLIGLPMADRPVQVVDPSGAADALPISERRAGLFVTKTRVSPPDVFVRDGVDDTGPVGSVAWGGRGSDIIVTQAPVADPMVSFADVSATRPDDHVKDGQDNHIYVRVFNGSAAPQDISVDLFAAPFETLTDASGWSQIGATQVAPAVPGRGWAFAPVFTWADAAIGDPAPGATTKQHHLVAIIWSGPDARPDPSGISTLAEFWAFFRSADQANNAAFRAIPYRPA